MTNEQKFELIIEALKRLTAETDNPISRHIGQKALEELEKP